MKTLLIPAAVAACLALLPAPARAETRACMPITSLPATLTTSGVYCLTADLSTAMASGSAIDIAAHAVTIDCNGYKLGGLAAGPDTTATGISASAGLIHAVVRNCNIRGFRFGIALGGTGIHVVDNRLDGIVDVGIQVSGQHNEVARNRVLDIDSPGSGTGIITVGSVRIEDNLVSGVTSEDGDGNEGIYVSQATAVVLRNNRIRSISGSASQISAGVHLKAVQRATVTGNQIVSTGVGQAFHCESIGLVLFAGNTTSGFTDESTCHAVPD